MAMRRSFFSTTLGKITGVIVIVALSVVAARWYVSKSPRESNRVRHPAGYSVIYPDGWSPDMRHGSGNTAPGIPPTRDFIYLSPVHYLGQEPALFVKRLIHAVDVTALKAEGWTDGTFQNQPAFLFYRKLKHSTVRGGIFQRNDQWFEVEETLPFASELEDAQWWSFLETFKYPDGPIDPEMNRAIPTATLPAAAPAPAPNSTESSPAATQPIVF